MRIMVRAFVPMIVPPMPGTIVLVARIMAVIPILPAAIVLTAIHFTAFGMPAGGFKRGQSQAIPSQRKGKNEALFVLRPVFDGAFWKCPPLGPFQRDAQRKSILKIFEYCNVTPAVRKIAAPSNAAIAGPPVKGLTTG